MLILINMGFYLLMEEKKLLNRKLEFLRWAVFFFEIANRITKSRQNYFCFVFYLFFFFFFAFWWQMRWKLTKKKERKGWRRSVGGLGWERETEYYNNKEILAYLFVRVWVRSEIWGGGGKTRDEKYLLRFFILHICSLFFCCCCCLFVSLLVYWTNLSTLKQRIKRQPWYKKVKRTFEAQIIIKFFLSINLKQSWK